MDLHFKERCHVSSKQEAPNKKKEETPSKQERRHTAKQYEVEITSYSHDRSETVGYAEGKISGREFTTSWATWEPVGGLFFDIWFDTTRAHNKAIVKALSRIDGCCPTPGG